VYTHLWAGRRRVEADRALQRVLVLDQHLHLYHVLPVRRHVRVARVRRRGTALEHQEAEVGLRMMSSHGPSAPWPVHTSP
jgi:hypothetical protein